MKNCSLLLAIMLTAASSAFSQKAFTWKGGTPGQENNWNCAKNWVPNEVPNEFADIIIPDVSTTTMASPVVSDGRFEVNSMFLQSTALLTIEANAQLIVHEQADGINAWNIRCDGSLLTPRRQSLLEPISMVFK